MPLDEPLAAGERSDPPARTVRLLVAYEGGAYHGWQSQRGAVPTVGEAVAAAIESVVRHPIDLVGASRTDRGVHARGQVASFSTTSAVTDRQVRNGANARLPDDIAVIDASTVEAGFNARHSAVGKHYRYTCRLSAVRDVFTRSTAWRLAADLDVEAMRQAAAALIGEHDFKAFATASKSPPATSVRAIDAIVIGGDGRIGGRVTIDVIGSAFLYNMVRTIAGTLVEVGLAKRPAAAVEGVLASRDRRRAGPTAPAHGLCLIRVFYDVEALRRACGTLAEGSSDAGDGIDSPAGF